jgi:hypothetical protein
LKVNPDSVSARSLQVAIAFLEGRQDDYARGIKEVLALRPNYGEVYRVVGDHAARKLSLRRGGRVGEAGDRHRP